MPFTITQMPNTVTAEPLFMGTVDPGTPSVSATFNGRSYTVTPEASYWSLRIPPEHRITATGSYTLTATVGSQTLSMTTNFAPPLSEVLDTPTFVIPDSGAIITVTAASADTTTSEFMNFTADTSSSCDMFGTVQGLASKLTRTVRDTAGNIIGTIKESTATIVASIRSSMSEMFGGSGGFLNSIKGYIADAASWVRDMQAGMNEVIGNITTWARDVIAAGQSTVYDAVVVVRARITAAKNQVTAYIDNLQTKFSGIMTTVRNATAALTGWLASARDFITQIPAAIGNAVRGIAQASCNTINTVLAGTPSDAFANITNGATDAAVKTFGAVKDVFNSGAENIADVYERITDSTGIGDIFGNAESSMANVSSAVTARATATVNTVSSERSSLYTTISNKPVIA